MCGVAQPRVGIVGAGMAGLACASQLREAGFAVTLLDKGRGAGGRMALRRLETPLGDVRADLGAQVMRACDPAFAKVAEAWAAAGLLTPWPEAGQGQWVGVPTMNALLKAMTMHLDVRFGCLVKALAREGGQWWFLAEGARFGPFDAAVTAIPPDQAAPLLSLHDFDQARAALSVPMAPCWTGIYVFDRQLPVARSYWRGSGIIERALRESAKPGRQGPETWVVQASGDWSRDHLEEEPERIGEHLLNALSAMLDLPRLAPLSRSLHGWRYATPSREQQLNLWNPHLRLGACGDWLMGSTVEAAWLSGTAMAARMTQDMLDAMQQRYEVGS